MTVVASKYARKENDLYQTEPWATEALLRHFPVEGVSVWEPAAGNHLMSDVIWDKGAVTVVTSDIKVYDKEHTFLHDFLNHPDDLNPNIDAIVTNPPYGVQNRDAVKFAKRALACCNGMIALLLTAKFDFGSTRTNLFRDNPRFIAKINLIDRICWELNGETGTEDHAWYIWGPKPLIPVKPVIFYAGREAA